MKTTGKTDEEIFQRFSCILVTNRDAFSVQQLGPLLCGCLKSLMIKTKKTMKEGKIVHLSTCMKLFEVFESLQYKTIDLREVVKEFMNVMDKSILTEHNILHEHVIIDKTKDILSHEKLLKEFQTKIVNELFRLIKDSFQTKTSSLITNQIDGVMQGMVGEHSSNSSGRNEFIQSIINISCKGKYLTKGIGSLVNTSGDTKTPDVSDIAMGAARKGLKAINNGDVKEVVDTALGFAGEGFDTFGDEKTKRVGKFATDAARKGLNLVDKEDVKEVVGTALGIASEGFDTFGDEKTKRVGKFATDATRKGLNSVDKGDVKEVVDTAIGIAGEGFDMFGDEKSKRVGKFATDAARKGLNAVDKEDVKEVVDTALGIIGERFDVWR